MSYDHHKNKQLLYKKDERPMRIFPWKRICIGHMKNRQIFAILALALPALAQQQVWGQCEYVSDCFETV